MKISSVQNYQNLLLSNKKNRINKKTQDSTYQNYTEIPNTYGKDLVTFKSKASIEKAISKLSLDDKIAFAYNKIDLGEFVVVAKDLNNAMKHLKNIGERIATPIEKIHFMPHNSMEEVVLLYLNIKGEKMMLNPLLTPIRLNGFEQIEPNTEKTLEDDDRVRLGNKWIQIRNYIETDLDLVNNSDLLLKTFDYSKETRESLRKNNVKIMKDFLTPSTIKKTKPNLSFDNIGGQDEVIKKLKKYVLNPMKCPDAYFGITPAVGAILTGIPGTGKSLIAKTLIAESGYSGFEISAARLQDQYVGQSEKKCEELFQKAIDAQPSIIFLDEIDALGKKRGNDVHGDKLLEEFLYCMSELEKTGDKVFIIGATNNDKCLDDAFVRSCRFDLILECKAPDLDGVRQIFDIHTKNVPLDENLDKELIVKKMFEKKMTGADIKIVVRDSYLEALDRTGISEYIENDRFSSGMMDYFKLENNDFIKVIEEYNNNKNEHKPIGFNKKK